LPLPPPRGDYRTFVKAQVTITDAGRTASAQ